MKIVQNALFRSCGTRFAQIAFWSVKVLKIVKLASNSLQNGKIVRLPSKLYKTLFWGHAQHVLAKSHLRASMFSKIVTLASNSSQYGKTVRSSWKLYKTHFSGHAQHVLAKSHFGATKFSKSSHWPNILFKTGKQCAFYKNCTRRSFQVMRSTFWPNRSCERQISQNRHTFFQILFKTGKQCALHQNCTKRPFQVMRSTFWPNRILERQSFQNCHAGFKFCSKWENSALSMKTVQNALFRSCGARFAQIAFWSGEVLKIVKLASNSL